MVMHMERAPVTEQVIPPITPEPAPELEYTFPEVEPTPEEAFSVHVASVRENGDIIDAVSAYTHTSTAIRQNLLLAGGLAPAVTVAAEAPITSGVASVLMLGAQAVYAHAKSKKSVRRTARMTAENASAAVGEMYELFRVADAASGQPEIVMRWYGLKPPLRDALFDKGRKLDESLVKVAELAQAEGIGAIMVAPDLLAQKMPQADVHKLATVDVRQWMKDFKGINIRFRPGFGREEGRTRKPIKPQVNAYTPEQLLAIARSSEDITYTDHTLSALVSTLRARKPEHPIVGVYDRHKAHGSLAAVKVIGAAERCLEDRLEDVRSMRMPSIHGIPQREKAYLQGIVGGDTARWQLIGSRFELLPEVKDLYEALGTSLKEVHDITRNPENYTDKEVILAAECLAYNGLTLPEEKNRPKERPNTMLAIGAAVQDVVAESVRDWRGASDRHIYCEEGWSGVDSRYVKIPRALIAAGLVAGAVAGLAGADAYFEGRKENILAASAQAYADRLDKPVEKLSEAQLERAHEWGMEQNPGTRGYLTFRENMDNAAEAAHDWVFEGVASWFAETEVPDYTELMEPIAWDPSAQVSGLGNGSSRTGNVRLAGDEPVTEWRVSAPSQVDTSGYWATSTGQIVYPDGQWWDSYYDTYGYEPYELPTEPYSMADQLITVSRNLDYDDVFLTDLNDVRGKVIDIPVLQGYYPVTANYNGEPVTLMPGYDNTYTLFIAGENIDTGPNSTRLTYQLAPSRKSSDPHATEELLVYNSSGDGDEQIQRSAEIWEEYIGDDFRTPEERARAAAQYISSEFEYSYEPLDDDTEEALLAGLLPLDEFLQRQMKDGEAVCNTAVLMVAAGNPQLNAAFGYRAEDDANLMDHDAHAWLIDGSGQIYEPTPGANGTAANQTVSAESLPLAETSLALLGIAGMAAFALRSRRLEKWRAEKRLKFTSAANIARAKYVADRVAYAEDFDLAKVSDGRGMSRKDALDEIRKHQVHSDHVADEIAARMKTASWQEKRALRRAQRVIRAVQHAGLATKLIDPHAQPDVVTVGQRRGAQSRLRKIAKAAPVNFIQ